MAESMESDQLLHQANNVWKMLDDLAETDPEAYKKLMDKTLKEGSEHFQPPQPYFCISTVMLPEVVTHKIYVNVCGWDQIPGPKSDKDPIPVMAGQVLEMTDEDPSYSIVDVIFNTKVLRQIEHRKDHRNLLVHLALDYLEETKKIQVSRKYKNMKINYKGNTATLRKYLQSGTEGKRFQDDIRAPSDTGPDSKESLLQQLSSIAVRDSNEGASGVGLFERDTKRTKKGLIQEVSSSAHSNTKGVIPKYELSVRNAENGKPRRLVITVELPGVSSVADCELDISEADLVLSVPSLYGLQLVFPERVDDSKATATFNRVKNKLVVKMPTKRIKR